MDWSLLFVIIIMVLLLRVVYLRMKANSVRANSFKALPDRDKLAVLKECLLNNCSRTNLMNLADFAKEHGIEVDTAAYLPLIDRQMKNAWGKNVIAEDNAIYTEQSAWVDRIAPFEFTEAQKALQEGRTDDYIQLSVEGISRLYSDDAILAELGKLAPHYKRATVLAEGYRELIAIRDESGADEKSLDALRKKRDAWMSELLTK